MERASELEGRTALVTGASRGIGLASARALASAGARLVLVSRDEQRLRRAAAALAAEGSEVLTLAADITQREWLERLDALAPVIDVLVNNAAAFAPYGSLEEVAEADIERVLGTTLLAPLLLTRHVLAGMKQRGFGRIVNIGSVAGRLGGAGQVAYSTAKAGLVGLTVTVAIECARSGVTCNMLELGLVGTERALERIPEQTRARIARNTPVGRAGTVEEVAHAVRFLASPLASYLTGAIVPVSGGLGLGLYPEQLG